MNECKVTSPIHLHKFLIVMVFKIINLKKNLSKSLWFNDIESYPKVSTPFESSVYKEFDGTNINCVTSCDVTSFY